MGRYISKGNADFAEARNLEYVDKSNLIVFVNGTLSTPAKMTCVSRARRFGKSLALQMLYAYYDCSCDSHHLFDDLDIAKDSSYEKYLNKYLTIHLDMTSFIILLVGVNYDRKTKKHGCRIEKWSEIKELSQKTQGVGKENSRSKRENSRSIKMDKIVRICSEPKSLEEIAFALGVKDRNFMKRMYIDPILGSRLKMTEPDSPNSPTQKYVKVNQSDK